MKHIMSKVWAVICLAWASTASTLTAFAAEQGTEATGTADLMPVMDVLQKVSLVIIIVAVALLLAFYVAKTVLKRLHVPPEVQEEPKQE